MNYQEIEKLCREKYSSGGALASYLERAVCHECADGEADFRRQIPRRTYTRRIARMVEEQAQESVAGWVEADMDPEAGFATLSAKLTAEDVLRSRPGRLVAWAVAQKLRGRP